MRLANITFICSGVTFVLGPFLLAAFFIVPALVCLWLGWRSYRATEAGAHRNRGMLALAVSCAVTLFALAWCVFAVLFMLGSA